LKTLLYSVSIADANLISPQKNKNSTRKRASITLLNAVRFAVTTEKTTPHKQEEGVLPKNCMIPFVPAADAKLKFLFSQPVTDLFIAEIASPI